MSALFIALAVGGGFLLGLRVGLGVSHRNARSKRAKTRPTGSAEGPDDEAANEPD